MPITTTYFVSTSYPVVSTGSLVTATFVNGIVNQIKTVFSSIDEGGYQIGGYLSLEVNSSTRVLARGYNSILSDLDLVYRHYSGQTVTNTLTNLTAYNDAWVVSTGSVITVSHWHHASQAAALALANRYNLHPSQLVTDPNGCSVVYDHGVSERNISWGTGTDQSIELQFRCEWPTPALANSFFNLGSDLVFSPFYSSMGLLVDDVLITGLVGYQFQTAQDIFVNTPLSVNPVGRGQGPVYHVDGDVDAYGSTATWSQGQRLVDSNYGRGISGNSAYLSQDPTIVGTPFQFVGLHYGDYTTQLFIGCRYGQSVSVDRQFLEITIDGGLNKYQVQVPGRFDKYSGPSSPAYLDGLGLGSSGWWIWEFTGHDEWGGGIYEDRLYGWIDIYSGRKGPDPIGLTQAVTDRAPHTLSILPTGTGIASSGAATGPGSTVTNAWAQFIDELNISTSQSFQYNRSQWIDAGFQTTTTLFTTTQNQFTIEISAQRDEYTPFQSKGITFTVTATNTAVGSWLRYYDPYTYAPSSQTCTNTVNLTNNFEAAKTEYTASSGGGGGGSFPWWVVAVAVVAECFTAETLVWCADGTKRPISSIEIGTEVWNHDKTKVNKVLFVEQRASKGATLFSPSPLYRPFVTDNHPLIVNNELFSADPTLHWQHYPWLGTAEQLNIDSKSVTSGETVYNLWLDGDHTYWVNDWATHSIIDDGAFLRLSVEQGYITQGQAIDLLRQHVNNGDLLRVGSYYVNKWLGSLNNTGLNRWMAETLSSEESWAKRVLWKGMQVVGAAAQVHLWIKYRYLGRKFLKGSKD